MLRAFYHRFDGVFLLNTEQREAFAAPDMGLPPRRRAPAARRPPTAGRPARP
jgi:hypothetical protein